MNNEKIGESVSMVMKQMIPLLAKGATAKSPILELKVKDVNYQVVIQMVPEGNPWLKRGEIKIKNKDGDATISLKP